MFGWPRRGCSSRAPPRASGERNDYNVLAKGVVVGRIMRAIVAPVGSPWFWPLAYGYHHDRKPTHGYAATREAAMAAFAKKLAAEMTTLSAPAHHRGRSRILPALR